MANSGSPFDFPLSTVTLCLAGSITPQPMLMLQSGTPWKYEETQIWDEWKYVFLWCPTLQYMRRYNVFQLVELFSSMLGIGSLNLSDGAT